ncbi:polyprenyl diphosphate synthase [Glycomyces tenuis]|uniref:polyprenyl diphosphate synthase n=1 Tax=Glycomyces tenuis TaxID=58116 RepID=UPI0003F4E002|nr:polyprenyl diphosphate synthase [Glycomyces tenuis]
MDLTGWLYKAYARRLRRQLRAAPLPRHVALVMDGNRRWARQMGFDDPSDGHRHGAEHLDEVLKWCDGLGIDHVTVYLASSDNLRKRDGDEVAHLMAMIEQVIAERLRRPEHRWRLHLAGRLDALPASTAAALEAARDATAGRELHLTVAIGYDGQEEIVDAVRSLIGREAASGSDLAALAERLEPSDIAAHLHTSGPPEPDLVIRTSGERRMSSFLPWQTARSELYFTDAYWPGFRYVDFLRALRAYAARLRRGTA